MANQMVQLETGLQMVNPRTANRTVESETTMRMTRLAMMAPTVKVVL